MCRTCTHVNTKQRGMLLLRIGSSLKLEGYCCCERDRETERDREREAAIMRESKRERVTRDSERECESVRERERIIAYQRRQQGVVESVWSMV